MSVGIVVLIAIFHEQNLQDVFLVVY